MATGPVLAVLATAVLLLSIFNLWMGSQHHHGSSSTHLAPLSADRVLSFQQQQQQQPGASSIETKRIVETQSGLHRPPLPPLSSILTGEWNITGKVPSNVLDFAVTGFPKCGTSTLMHQLRLHPEIAIFAHERCDLSYNQQAKLIRDLYKLRPNVTSSDDSFYRALKCPMDLESPELGLPNYNRYFPNTSFIIGIRHPIAWFESFYNHRIANGFPLHKRPVTDLIGKCGFKMFGVCTFRSNFHLFLSNLQLTARSDAELELMGRFRRKVDPVGKTNRSVLIYELSQLKRPQFRTDLQDFLHLTTPIPSMMHFAPGKNKTTSSEQKRDLKKYKIHDICDPAFAKVTAVLQAQAVNVSRWMRHYLLPVATTDKDSSVTVSEPDYLDQVLQEWEGDFCVLRRQKHKEQAETT